MLHLWDNIKEISPHYLLLFNSKLDQPNHYKPKGQFTYRDSQQCKTLGTNNVVNIPIQNPMD